MDEWEYFRIAVSHRENNNLDFVGKKDKDPSSIATHGGMKARFNVTPDEWQAYLQSLRDEGWELLNVDTSSSGSSETYTLKRPKV